MLLKSLGANLFSEPAQVDIFSQALTAVRISPAY